MFLQSIVVLLPWVDSQSLGSRNGTHDKCLSNREEEIGSPLTSMIVWVISQRFCNNAYTAQITVHRGHPQHHYLEEPAPHARIVYFVLT